MSTIFFYNTKHLNILIIKIEKLNKIKLKINLLEFFF